MSSDKARKTGCLRRSFPSVTMEYFLRNSKGICQLLVGGSIILSLFLDARFNAEGNLTHFVIEVLIVDVND